MNRKTIYLVSNEVDLEHCRNLVPVRCFTRLKDATDFCNNSQKAFDEFDKNRPKNKLARWINPYCTDRDVVDLYDEDDSLWYHVETIDLVSPEAHDEYQGI